MSKQPLVSVVIPCYNHEVFIQDCIQSVIDQTYKNIELIIIDDGSIDNSVNQIKEMVPACKNRFIRFEFRSRPNKGLSSTLNEALEWCQGEYYSAIASDDIMLKDKTDIQVKFLNDNKKIVAVFGGVKLIDENNREIDEIIHSSKYYTFKEIIMHEHDLPAPTQMIRLASIKNVGGYDSDILIEDWYMWIKLSKEGSLYYMSNLLSFYRQHTTNISKNLEKMHRARFDVLNAFKNSIYYRKAYRKIEWINNIENIISKKEPKILKIIRIIFLNPMRASILILNKIKRSK